MTDFIVFTRELVERGGEFRGMRRSAGARTRRAGSGDPDREARAIRGRIEVVPLTEREATERAREPGTMLARRFRTRLIAPTARGRRRSAEGDTAWGLEAIGATASRLDGRNVTVAVLDTGIDCRHPAFEGITLVEKDFSGDGDGDREGHGTHCAGIIFGRDVAGTRIGVARGSRGR